MFGLLLYFCVLVFLNCCIVEFLDCCDFVFSCCCFSFIVLFIFSHVSLSSSFWTTRGPRVRPFPPRAPPARGFMLIAACT